MSKIDVEMSDEFDFTPGDSCVIISEDVDIRKVSGWNLATYEAYERDGETFNMIGVYRP